MAVEQSLDYDAVHDFAERFVGVWNAHDAEGILSLVSEDVTWDDPVMLRTAHGRGAAREYITTLFRAFPDIEWTMPGAVYIVPGDGERDGIVKVAQPWKCRGTLLGPIDPPGFAPTGRTFEMQGVDLWELRRSDRLLCRVSSHYDMLRFAQRVGLMPPRGSRAEGLVVRLQRLWARAQRRRLR
jgi:steroid delta-isomerase-like uncharacterized protein